MFCAQTQVTWSRPQTPPISLRRDGFDMIELLRKGQYTYVQHVQSESVMKATENYNKNITVNYVYITF